MYTQIWKSLKFLNLSRYEVSNDGNVRDVAHYSAKTVPSRIDDHGYVIVSLQHDDDDGYRNFQMHRLVALTFIACPGKPKDYQVNHKDEIKTHNYVDNLNWATPKENTQYSIHKKHGSSNGNNALTEQAVLWIRQNYKARDKLFGTSGMAKRFNVHNYTIYNIIHRKSWTHI